jgi:hypothetical protein
VTRWLRRADDAIRAPLLPLPEVATSGTGACSANAVLFPRRADELAALRIGRDLGLALEALALPQPKEETDAQDHESR